MAPKAKAKGKAKGKFGRGKAKGQGGGRGAAAAQPGVEPGGEQATTAIVPKVKAFSLRAKVMKELGDGSVSMAIETQKERITQCEASVLEAEALEKAHATQEAESQAELAAATKEVQSCLKKEQDLMEEYKEVKKKVEETNAANAGMTTKLDEAKRKLAMMELIGANQRKISELQNQRNAVREAALQAKQAMALQKQREKEALEATRKQLAELRAGMKRGAARSKPATEEPPAKVQAVETRDQEPAVPSEANTVPVSN